MSPGSDKSQLDRSSQWLDRQWWGGRLSFQALLSASKLENNTRRGAERARDLDEVPGVTKWDAVKRHKFISWLESSALGGSSFEYRQDVERRACACGRALGWP
jgi:hypothetical protein